MEILNKKHAILTNFEVMNILQDSLGDKKKHGLKNLATICYETLQYLTESPLPTKTQNRENLVEFRKEMKQFQLTDTEIYAMVNDPPTSLLHIQLLVEDSEERLTEDQVSDILSTIQRLLLPPPPEAETEGGDANEENSVEDETIQDDEAVES